MSEELEATLKKIPELVRKREESLDEREKKLAKLQKTIDEKHPSLGKPDDVLELNVGGTPLATLRRTLTQIENSVLASKFSGRWDDGLEKDSQGRFFIDQPIELFLPLLNHLRALATSTPASGPPPAPRDDDVNRADFYRMVEYYGLTLGVYSIGVYSVQTGGARTLIASRPDDYAVTSSGRLSTYVLLPEGNMHGRYVKSFEVTLDSHSAAQIGWMDRNQTFQNLRQSGGQGVGYENRSIAFDCVRSGLVADRPNNSTSAAAQFVALRESVPIKAGTVIRCDSYGQSWSIDGKLVASLTPNGDNRVIQVPNTVGISSGACVPCLTLNGGFKISAIEFDFPRS